MIAATPSHTDENICRVGSSSGSCLAGDTRRRLNNTTEECHPHASIPRCSEPSLLILFTAKREDLLSFHDGVPRPWCKRLIKVPLQLVCYSIWGRYIAHWPGNSASHHFSFLPQQNNLTIFFNSFKIKRRGRVWGHQYFPFTFLSICNSVQDIPNTV